MSLKAVSGLLEAGIRVGVTTPPVKTSRLALTVFLNSARLAIRRSGTDQYGATLASLSARDLSNIDR